mmetsp:Transcript_55304/g.177301  ORF Transcript_55304/g.177301 Transcript_55304/m.177301 type:complete len:259 (-) Transcript_55304:725-1501(-)
MMNGVPTLGVWCTDDRLDALTEPEQQRHDLTEHASLDRIDDHVPAPLVQDVEAAAVFHDSREKPPVVLVHGHHDWSPALAIVRLDACVRLQQQVHHILIAGLQCAVQGRLEELVLRVDRATRPQQHIHDVDMLVAGSVEERRPPVRVRDPDVCLGVQEPAQRMQVAIASGVDQRGPALLVGGVHPDCAVGQEQIEHDELDPVRVELPDGLRVHVLDLTGRVLVLALFRLASGLLRFQKHCLLIECVHPDPLPLSAITP